MVYYKRHIQDEIRKHLERKENTIIVGARQVGKTVLIRELYNELKKKGNRAFYLTFENKDILREVNMHPENVFKFTDRPVNPLEQAEYN